MNKTERIGVSKVQLIVNEELGWIFREQQIEDYGIDAHIEIQDRNYAKGKMIAVQIKSGESYFLNISGNQIVYYAKQKHLNYWRNSILPVIIILYNTKTKQCLWHYFDGSLKSNKIIVDTSNIFDSSAKLSLEKIANLKPYEIFKRHRRDYVENNYNLNLLKEQGLDSRIKQPTPLIGHTLCIDLGTSMSRFATINSTGDITYVKSHRGKNYFDSVIGFDSDYQYYIGEEVIETVDNSSFIIIRNFKRELGLEKKYAIFGLELSAEDITTLFLWKIILIAEKQFNMSFNRCWLSEPVDFSYYQKRAYEHCLVNCGLEIVRVLSESSCVAINPQLVDRENEYIVIDLGGGTLDSSILSIESGIIEVLATVGNRTIGGIDYDNLLSTYIENKIRRYYPEIIIDEELSRRLVYTSEEIKIYLSQNEKATVMIPGCHDVEGENLFYCKISVDRNEFRETVKVLDDRLEGCLVEIKNKYMEYEHESNNEVSYNILLGGMGSRIFTVIERIKNVFPKCKIIDNYFDKSVVDGLAYYSGKLQGYEYSSDILLLDVAFCSIILYGDFICKYTDGEEERLSEIPLLPVDVAIPYKRIVEVVIQGEQEISMLLVCGQHRDIVKRVKLGRQQKETEYEITADIDASNQIEIIISNLVDNSEDRFVVERPLVRKDISL